jgi:hypothetical protein
MRSAIAIGAGAGLIGGAVAALVLSILGIKGHEGQIARAITLVSHTVHSDGLVGGWLVEVVIAVAVGALFGVLYAAAGLRRESAAFWATFYSLVCWIVGWFAVMPPPLRFAPWAALKDPTLFQLAVAGLISCLGFGAVLAGAFTLFGPLQEAKRDARVGVGRPAPSNGALSASRR